jgi:hypothetical protein
MRTKRIPEESVPNLEPSDNGQAPASDPPQPPASDQPKPATADVFADLSRLRLSQDFTTSCEVKKALVTIPVRKPATEWFVRTHPELRIETCVLELKEGRETYLVAPDLWAELAIEPTFSPRALFVTMTPQNVLFVWPIKLPGPDGKIDDWNRAALETAILAQSHWVRIASSKVFQGYDVTVATANWAEPKWPELPLNEILKIAFKGRVITALDHPTLKRLRGED